MKALSRGVESRYAVGMKITDVEVIDLRAEVPAGHRTDEAFVGCVVRVHTDAGIAGIAEVASAPPVIRAIIDPPRSSLSWPSLKSVLVGTDAGDPEAAWDAMYAATHYYGRRGVVIHAISALDIALWDILGKAEGKPVGALLGMPMRDRVPAYLTLANLGTDRDRIRERLDRAAAMGVRAIKLCATPEWGRDPGLAELVLRTAREHLGPGMGLMLDVYAHWKSAEVVLPLFPLFREVGLAWLEAPLPMDDLDGFARLSGQGVAIAAGDMGLTTRFEFAEMIAHGRADILQPDATMVGGLTEMRRVAALARQHGRRLVPHGYKSNILLATNLAFLGQHWAAEPLEYSLAESPLRWNLTRESLPIQRDGKVLVPTAPGLGVSLNEATLAAYRRL